MRFEINKKKDKGQFSGFSFSFLGEGKGGGGGVWYLKLENNMLKMVC